MIALVILPSLALVGAALWAICDEAPAVAHYREVGADEPSGPIERGRGGEF